MEKYGGEKVGDYSVNKFEETLFQTNVNIQKAIQLISKVNDIENFIKKLDEQPLNVHLVGGLAQHFKIKCKQRFAPLKIKFEYESPKGGQITAYSSF